MEHPFEGCRQVTLEEMLDARERRALEQRAFLAHWGGPLISFTLIIPGEYKVFPLARRAFVEGTTGIEKQLHRHGIPINGRWYRDAHTGEMAFFAAAGDTGLLKTLMVELEDRHPLGRLFDIDVLDKNGVGLHRTCFGGRERTCLICGKPVWKCSRSRVHDAEELARRVVFIMETYFQKQYAGIIAKHALKALLFELGITPKPGLVDRSNSGAHEDMDYFTFVNSAAALVPYFYRVTLESQGYQGESESLLASLGFYGQEAEETMNAETGGVNTHKGLIFSLGIMCAALGYLHGQGLPVTVDTVLALCGRIAAPGLAKLDQGHTSAKVQTHGEKVYAVHGIRGIRGEAAAGFPSLALYGYPLLSALLNQGYSANDAGVILLLHLLAQVQDTNILYRAGINALEEIQKQVQDFLARESDPEELLAFARDLDQDFIRRHISPGGCADLVALSFMLYFCVETTPEKKVHPDPTPGSPA
ncbi:MAG: citrate lyase holo-[acyl-carrier protein] synthase [Treponema sp.]|jgi:holo-ACP synthase/triphosphoribosyl-dephospho-CoA synthase|nr:citrate lyase holo-[acyl-carrier protein] synthase [Treponema sp.]